MRPGAILVLGFAVLLPACDQATQESREVSSTRVVMRPHVPVPPGTVPRGTGAYESALAAPGPQPTPEIVQRGRERFAVFCSPCHGATGRGDGIVVGRGFPRPPSYLEDRLRQAPPEAIVAVITNGTGAMYSYAERVPPEDRWAIAHFVKALQSEAAPPAALRPTP